MKIHVEVTLPDDLSPDVDLFAEHYYGDNRYRRARYILGAIREKVARDKGRRARCERSKK